MEQLDILRHAADTLDRLKIPYMIVGSYGCFAYGEARFTQDIDIVIEMFPGQVNDLYDAFPSPEFYISKDSVREAIRNRFQFNVLHPSSGSKIDFILARQDEWGQTRMARRRMTRIHPDRDISTASPEDIILGKLWYFSEGGSNKHLRDIASILKVSGEAIDRKEITKWAAKLGYSEIWEKCLAKVSATQSQKS